MCAWMTNRLFPPRREDVAFPRGRRGGSNTMDWKGLASGELKIPDTLPDGITRKRRSHYSRDTGLTMTSSQKSNPLSLLIAPRLKSLGTRLEGGEGRASPGGRGG